MKVRKRKPRWKKEELKLLWETFGFKGFSKKKAEELSEKLGRSVIAIRAKYKELYRRATQYV
jgi:tellurite resistance protein